jgi:hypothetical protein
MRGIRSAAALAAAFAALGLSAGPALAAGGSSIGTAPTVGYGQQEFGNTLTDGGTAGACWPESGGESWWLLPVVAGDSVKVDLEGPTQGGDGFLVEAYPAGTSDYTVSQTHAYASVNTSFADQSAGQLAFTASSTGVMPMAVVGCDQPGTYDFTASDAHKIVLGLSLKGTNRARHRSSFTLQAHRPDGTALSGSGVRATPQLLSGGRWRNLASGAPPFNFTVSWPARYRGRWQSVRVVASGSGYLNATSQTVRVKAL